MPPLLWTNDNHYAIAIDTIAELLSRTTVSMPMVRPKLALLGW